MIRRPPRSTRTDTLFPYTTLVRSGNYLRISPSSVSIIGYHPEEMIGQSGIRFILPDDLAMARSEMRLMREGRQMRNFTCRYRHQNGQAVTLAWTGQWPEPDRRPDERRGGKEWVGTGSSRWSPYL